VAALGVLLDTQLEALHARSEPHGWTLLHAAAHRGHLAAVDLLLARGLDVNVREKGDNTYPLHWAAAAGHVDVVRRLLDAGGDPVGHGDDHELEVIGWAACWDGCEDDAHRQIVELLRERGARHHIFSAIAMNDAGEVRRIVTEDPAALNRRQSRNENHRMPLHFAVARNAQPMVALLLELGADPLAVDGWGQPAAAYATSADADALVMERIAAMTRAELTSAARGIRAPRGTPLDLMALLTLGDRETAATLLAANPALVEAKGGVLHLMAKRNHLAAVEWLLARGADSNGRWAHWDADVTPLHLAAWHADAALVRALLDAGGDPRIHDSKHDSDAIGWAEHFERPEIARILRDRVARA
jgi:ankyrin repeat protein